MRNESGNILSNAHSEETSKALTADGSSGAHSGVSSDTLPDEPSGALPAELLDTPSDKLSAKLSDTPSGTLPAELPNELPDTPSGNRVPSEEADDECFYDSDDCMTDGRIELLSNENAKRLDSFIANNTPLTRSAAQRLINSGSVLVNGTVCKQGSPVKVGFKIIIQLPKVQETDLVPENIPLNIVYEDSDIAVINKPVGMVVHPAPGNPSGTLVNAIMYHIHDLSGIGGQLRPGIVHRIDKNTSGLLVIAKNDFAHAFLSNELKSHDVKRIYIALCMGNFPEDSGTISAPIGRHRTDRKRMAVIAGARDAITHFRVIERFRDYTLLRVELETGRTHQIRVHMAYLNHPLVGDDVYSSGRNSLGFHGQALHACELMLRHPRTHELMRFHAPLPENYRNALRKLRNLR